MRLLASIAALALGMFDDRREFGVRFTLVQAVSEYLPGLFHAPLQPVPAR